MSQYNGIPETGCNFDTGMEIDQNMNKLPKVEESELTSNPFTYELAIPVTQIIKDIEFAHNAEGVLVNKVLYAEKTRKVELYIHETSRDNVANLSDKAQRMYLHILYTVKRKSDWIQINKEHYMKKNGVKSQTTYNEAIKELERYQYILKTHIKTVWWINPHRFFPGSRLIKYPGNIRVTDVWDQTNGGVTKDNPKKSFSTGDKENKVMEDEYLNNKK